MATPEITLEKPLIHDAFPKSPRHRGKSIAFACLLTSLGCAAFCSRDWDRQYLVDSEPDVSIAMRFIDVADPRHSMTTAREPTLLPPTQAAKQGLGQQDANIHSLMLPPTSGRAPSHPVCRPRGIPPSSACRNTDRRGLGLSPLTKQFKRVDRIDVNCTEDLVGVFFQIPTPATSGRTARHAAFTTFRHADASDLPMEIVEGVVPSWLAGTYMRNGPGRFEAGDRKLEHWFDGYGMLLRITLEPGALPRLATRFVNSDAHAAVREKGKLEFAEFMTPLVPPGSGVRNALASFAALAFGAPTDNAGVNILSRGSGGVVEVMTETQRSWFEIDTQSLATRTRVAWSGDDVGQLSTAHTQRDPRGGGWINVGTSITPPFWSAYRVFRLSDENPTKREVLATIPCSDRAAPNWLHSFGVTASWVVVIEQPAAYSIGAMVGVGTASHGSIEWSPERGTRVHVVDRATGMQKTHVVQPAFFFFHIANAFDGADGSVHLDICSFDDPQILTALRLENLLDDAKAHDLPTSRLIRLSVPTSGAPTMTPLDNEAVTGGFSDLPSIAPSAVGQPSYRFVYGIAAARPTAVANRLVKTDVSGAGGDALFELPGMLPGEPLFIPRPGAEAEDDGVVLAMGTDDDGGSSLYILDAQDMRLLARCRSPVALPAGFHGKWIPDEKGETQL